MKQLVRRHLKEIDMQNVTAHWMMLHLLNQGKLRSTSGNLKLDKDVLPDRVGKKSGNFALTDFQIAGLALVTIDDGWHNAAGAEVFDGVSTDFSAGLRGKFDLFCHGIRKVVSVILVF